MNTGSDGDSDGDNDNDLADGDGNVMEGDDGGMMNKCDGNGGNDA